MQPSKNCSVSSCWCRKITGDPKKLVEAIKNLSVSTLELNFRISKEDFLAIKQNRDNWGIKISSLHAVCPAPEGDMRGAEKFLISDENDRDRRKGVEQVIATLQNALEVGAKAIVLHCGRIPMKEPIYEMMKFYDAGEIDSPEANTKVHESLLERMTLQKKPFQALLKSLDEINVEAEILGIDVGLENRYYFGEVPNIEEFGVIFNRFSGGRLKYWHDTGHAHVQEKLFSVSQRVMLETFSSLLLGVHLHDVKGGYTDHNEPGCEGGEIDFAMVESFLKEDTIRVMELNPRVDRDCARRGVEFLRKQGIFS